MFYLVPKAVFCAVKIRENILIVASFKTILATKNLIVKIEHVLFNSMRCLRMKFWVAKLLNNIGVCHMHKTENVC